MTRDDRLDLIRGFALVTIGVNHFSGTAREMGYGGYLVPTLTNYGFSSAAELFFLLSGYMVGYVVLNRDDARVRLLRRTGQIYAVNLALFVGLAILSTGFDRPTLVISGFDAFQSRPIEAFGQFLLLNYNPYLLDILPIYVLLMAASVLLCGWLRQRLGLVVALSAALYLAAQGWLQINMPGGHPHGEGYWPFNPFSWQVLFMCGVVAGRHGWHVGLFAALRRARWMLPVLVAIVVAFAVAKRIASYENLRTPLDNKENLGALRLVHAGFVVLLLFAVIERLDRYRDSVPYRSLAMIGRHSLAGFSASIVAVYAAMLLLQGHAVGMVAYLLGTAFVLIAIGLAARLADHLKRRPNKGRGGAPAPGGSATVARQIEA